MKQKVSFLPDRFREAMSDANMTQATLAKRVGVSRRTIQRYMAGAPISEQTIRIAIPFFLRVNARWLTGTEDGKERCPNQKHLDKLVTACWALRKDDELLALTHVLAGLSEEERKQYVEILGTPADSESP